MSEAVEGAELMLYGVSERYKERLNRPLSQRTLSDHAARVIIVLDLGVSIIKSFPS